MNRILICFDITGASSTQLQLIKTLSKVDSLMRLRFNVKESLVPTDEISDIDPGNSDSIKNKMRKLHEDRLTPNNRDILT